MIEQTKVIYSPLGEAIEKQTKTIEHQGQKQIKALEKHGKQLIMSSGEKYYLEQTEIFDELVNERKFEINKVKGLTLMI